MKDYSFLWNDRKENNQAWKVSIDEIAHRNFNLEIKNPSATAPVSENHLELINEYQATSKKATEVQEKLKSILLEILG